MFQILVNEKATRDSKVVDAVSTFIRRRSRRASRIIAKAA